MITAAPTHEASRLQALQRYQVLDTPPEDAFDDLARLAAAVCGTPMAAIGLVDEDRVWLKSRVGLRVTEVPREGSAIAAAVLTAGLPVFEVGVVTAVGGQAVAYVGGAPLVSPDGFALGAIAVMDARERTLDAGQRQALQSLSRQAMALMELRRQSRVLAETVQELRSAETTIRRLANHDALTGLPSRRLFDDRLLHAMAHSRRNAAPVAVMFLDLDGFKSVNDTWGHAVGDNLLRAVAARLTGSLRQSDTVARIGGDEFALICPGVHGPDDAAGIARHLLAALSEPWFVSGVDLRVTASIGIALFPHDGATPDTLLMDADTAMYRAKRAGRNTFAFCPLSNVKNCVLAG